MIDPPTDCQPSLERSLPQTLIAGHAYHLALVPGDVCDDIFHRPSARQTQFGHSRLANFFGGSHGAGVPSPAFMKRATDHELNVRPMPPASRASQNQISVGDVNSGGHFELFEITRIIAGMKTSAVPGRMMIDLTSPQCIFRPLRESPQDSPSHGSYLPIQSPSMGLIKRIAKGLSRSQQVGMNPVRCLGSGCANPASLFRQCCDRHG